MVRVIITYISMGPYKKQGTDGIIQSSHREVQQARNEAGR